MSYGLSDLYKLLDEDRQATVGGTVSPGAAPRQVGIGTRMDSGVEDPGILRQALSATGRTFLGPVSLAAEVLKPIEHVGLEALQYFTSPETRAAVEPWTGTNIYERAKDWALPEARKMREQKATAQNAAMNLLMAVPRIPVAMVTGAMKGMEAAGRGGAGLGGILHGGLARAITEPFEQLYNLGATGLQSFQRPGQEGLVEIAERQGGPGGRLAGVLGEAVLPLAFGLKGAKTRALGRRQIEAGRRYGQVRAEQLARKGALEKVADTEAMTEIGQRLEEEAVRPSALEGVAERIEAERARFARRKNEAKSIAEQKAADAAERDARARVAFAREMAYAEAARPETRAKTIGPRSPAPQGYAETVRVGAQERPRTFGGRIPSAPMEPIAEARKTIGPADWFPPSVLETIERKRPAARIAAERAALKAERWAAEVAESTEAERRASRVAQEAAEAKRRPTIPVSSLWTPEITSQPRRMGALPPDISGAPKRTVAESGPPPTGVPTAIGGPVKSEAQIQREMMAGGRRVQRPEPRLPEGVLGAYPPNAQTILTKFRADPATAAHELGHHVENTLIPQAEFGPHRAFVESLSPEPGPTRFSEGFAEGVRQFVSERQTLESTPAGEAFSGWLKDELGRRAPKLSKALETASADLTARRAATPEQKIKAQILKAEPEWRKERMNVAERGYQGLVDSHYALEKAAEEAQRRGYTPTAADDLALGAREARNVSPLLQRWIEGEGPREGIPSLQRIYRESGNADTLEAYGVAKRDIELNAKRGIEPGGYSVDEARAYVRQIEAEHPEIVKANELRKKWNRAALEEYRDAGLLTPEAFARISAMNEEYIPFYRLLETVKGETGRGTVTPGVMKKITGRAAGANAPEILSPSIVEQRNLIAQRKRIDENEVGWKFYRMLKETPGSGDWGEILSEGTARLAEGREALLKSGDVGGLAKEMGIDRSYLERLSPAELRDVALSFDRIEAPSAGGRVKVTLKNLAGTREGLPREAIIAVDPEIWEGMRANTAPAQDWASRVLRRAGQVKRGAISEQVFGASLLTLKDILTAPFVSRAGAGAFLRHLPGAIADAFGRGATDVLNDRGLFSGIGKAEAIQSPKRFRAGLDALSRWIGPKASARLEGISRTAEYRGFLKRKTSDVARLIGEAEKTGAKAIVMDRFGRARIVRGAEGGTAIWKPGMTAADVAAQVRRLAADAAREVSGEFARSGGDPVAQWVKSVSPFWNQTLQGWRMDVVNLRRGTGTAAKIVLGAAIPSLLAWYAGRNDPRVRSMGQAERDANYLIPTPAGVVKIPRPYGVMALVGAMTERLAGKLYDDDPAFADEVWAMAGHELERALPVSNPFVQPLIEMGFGRRMDYWTRPLVPGSLARREAPEQALPSTTGLARGISAIPSAIFGPGSAIARKLNPIQIESLIRGFGGTLGTDVSRALDLLTPHATERPKESILTSLPIVRRLVARELQAYPRYVQSLDTAMERLSPVANEQKAIERESGRDSARAAEHYRRNRETLTKYELLSGYRKDLGQYRQAMAAIETSRASGTEKLERMRALAQKMNELARKGLQRAGE